jgi:hypothetical protein
MLHLVFPLQVVVVVQCQTVRPSPSRPSAVDLLGEQQLQKFIRLFVLFLLLQILSS